MPAQPSEIVRGIVIASRRRRTEGARGQGSGRQFRRSWHVFLIVEEQRTNGDGEPLDRLPREVDQWLGALSQMRLVQNAGRRHIEGPQSERAWLAYVQLTEGRVTYRIEQRPV